MGVSASRVVPEQADHKHHGDDCVFKEVLAQLGAAPCLQNQPQPQKISESGPPVSGPPVKLSLIHI